MSTVILEVVEEKEPALLEVLGKLPYVRVVNRQAETSPKPAYWQLLGKYRHTRVSSESLAAENEANKLVEGE